MTAPIRPATAPRRRATSFSMRSMKLPWGRRRRAKSRFRSAERRGTFFEQFDDGAGASFVAQTHSHARTAGGEHVGDPARLPVFLADHVADDGDFLNDRFVHTVDLEFAAVTAWAQQRLRKISGAAVGAPPDRDSRAHSTRSRIAAAA